MKLLAKNRRASFDYELGDRLTAGLALTGDEVKSIKMAHVSLRGAFILLRSGEAFLTGAHVTPYAHAFKAGADPTRQRKLLLHRRQLDQLIRERQVGNALIPTALVIEHGLIKLEMAVGRGKKRYDKREAIKRRDTARDLARGSSR